MCRYTRFPSLLVAERQKLALCPCRGSRRFCREKLQIYPLLGEKRHNICLLSRFQLTNGIGLQRRDHGPAWNSDK
jgi:hypothetical protein